MAKIILPSYPLITIDPFMSIWSPSDTLYGGDTQIWHGQKKRFYGDILIDRTYSYCFMGVPEEGEPVIPQTDLDITPLITAYTFQNESLKLTVKFWTPLIIDDIYKLSLPVSFIDYEAEFLDGKNHEFEILIGADREFCFDKHKKKLTGGEIQLDDSTSLAYMGCKNQTPLRKSGDGVSADWGYIYLSGDKGSCGFDKKGIHSIIEKTKGTFVFAFDDVKSIEYMGTQYPCLWTEKFRDIKDVIKYSLENRDELLNDAERINLTILSDSEKFGESYQHILAAAYRQVLAGHKLFHDKNGEILYFSKECHSNGCINTVDVSYPAVPLFLLYNPSLLKGMITGIFEFARLNAWGYDFAPHDIGQYPIANGQVYGHKNSPLLPKRKIYLESKCHCSFSSQMPVEECGNMLALSFLHYRFTGDKSVIENNYDILEKWANYLVNAGVVLENQLCTDDFAGHSEKNINLAVKGVLGIAFFGKISEALGKNTDMSETAKTYAKQLCENILSDGTLPFSVGHNDTWSLKYNMVWDKIFGLSLFPEELYTAESRKYREKTAKYGVPLDYRKSLTKTDWMMWAAVLDETGENIPLFAEKIEKYLTDTKETWVFSDWIDTIEPFSYSFHHRTVQGGLWMPVLADKISTYTDLKF